MKLWNYEKECYEKVDPVDMVASDAWKDWDISDDDYDIENVLDACVVYADMFGENLHVVVFVSDVLNDIWNEENKVFDGNVSDAMKSDVADCSVISFDPPCDVLRIWIDGKDLK